MRMLTRKTLPGTMVYAEQHKGQIYHSSCNEEQPSPSGGCNLV